MSSGKKKELSKEEFWALHVQSYFAKMEKENDSKDLPISRPDAKEAEHITSLS